MAKYENINIHHHHRRNLLPFDRRVPFFNILPIPFIFQIIKTRNSINYVVIDNRERYKEIIGLESPPLSQQLRIDKHKMFGDRTRKGGERLITKSTFSATRKQKQERKKNTSGENDHSW